MAQVAPPVNVGMIFRIETDGSLKQFTGETGIAGSAGLGSGIVCVVSSTGGGLSNLQPNVVAAQISAIGLPPPFNRRFVVDLGLNVVNTF